MACKLYLNKAVLNKSMENYNPIKARLLMTRPFRNESWNHPPKKES